MRRSIFDLRPAKPAQLDDLKAFIDRFGGLDMGRRRGEVPGAARINREIAQFIAMRACLRMPMP